MGCFSMRVRLTTSSHVARCARELSGAARRTRNRWWCLARRCTRHGVEFRGFADVLRVLGLRPMTTFRADCVFIARVGLLRRGVAASVCIADAKASPASTSLPRHGSQAPTRPSEYAICSSSPRSRRKTSGASGGEDADKVNAALCGLRTSVFFVIREAVAVIECRPPFRIPFRARATLNRLGKHIETKTLDLKRFIARGAVE